MTTWKIKGYRVIDVINPLKWYYFFLGWWINKNVQYAFCEQVVYRSITCQPCTDAGKCLHCKCKVPEKYMVPGDKCSEGNWGPMMSAEDWEDFKIGMGLTITILR